MGKFVIGILRSRLLDVSFCLGGRMYLILDVLS